ncbi:MAG: hypothetical protein WD490_05340 [Opitutales bacterium]
MEPEVVREERVLAWEEQLKGFAIRAKVDLNRLASQTSAPEKAPLAADMKRSTSVSNPGSPSA